MSDQETIATALSELSKEDLTPPESDKNQHLPILTVQLVKDIVADLLEVKKNGGHGGIALKHKVSTTQVRDIEAAMNERSKELAEAEIIP